jgi:hypothetical protein
MVTYMHLFSGRQILFYSDLDLGSDSRLLDYVKSCLKYYKYQYLGPWRYVDMVPGTTMYVQLRM